jgi:alkylation response protein AidB-like acyl-CoA dehydrogenase
MDLNYSTQDIAFRDEINSWLAGSLPQDLREKVLSYQELSKEELVRWHKILAGKGWIAPSWPVQWGGCDWSPVQKYLFEECCALAGAPGVAPFGPVMCASVLLKFGTEQQKQRFLPRIYQGDDFWVQGYSEPGSGSDLASLKTRADKQGDHYVVNGQKIWTTLGHFGDWIFCLVRTDASAEKRQEGISFLLVDMKTPGITVRPLVLLDEGHEVNEVFFDNVKVPVENLVHEENKGWTVAKYLLGHERLNTGRIGGSKRELAKLKAFASEKQLNGKSLMDDTRFRDRITRVEVELMALEVTNLRFIDTMQRTGQPPGAEVSILKIKGTEIQQAITELLMIAAGDEMQRFKQIEISDSFDDFTASIASRYFNFRKTSIYAGSNEIQRNIIAKMSLGL